ncbi:hypothetical protein NDU88_005661 [Pleurodeles waltl]|uniref:Uncharacterized protein n=1 Tax=Pleurodeles waltl TaxID=8319 RepID=A0AAV7MX00_PLEWA|nr:hypothetical protein NDU88_005661 [Pleurodeles waltl]
MKAPPPLTAKAECHLVDRGTHFFPRPFQTTSTGPPCRDVTSESARPLGDDTAAIGAYASTRQDRRKCRGEGPREA